MAKNTEGRTAYTAAEVADRWGLHERTIQVQLRDGRLRGFKVGKEWRIPASVVAEIEEGNLRNRCFASADASAEQAS
jgi:excisionase family DNA binding protein